jgi:hypothetical protein
VVLVVNVFVKNMDKEAYKLAKMLAAQQEKNIGRVLSESVFLFAQKKAKPGLAGFPSAHFGPGTEDLSRNIDKILYGD